MSCWSRRPAPACSQSSPSLPARAWSSTSSPRRARGSARAGCFRHARHRYDAAQIDDHLDPVLRPTVVLMNPPFSAVAHVERPRRRRRAAPCRRRRWRVSPKAGASSRSPAPDLSPDMIPPGATASCGCRNAGAVLFSAAIDGARLCPTRHRRRHAAHRHRRVPAEDPAVFPASPGIAADPAILLDWVTRLVPPRACRRRTAACAVPLHLRHFVARLAGLPRRSAKPASLRSRPLRSNSLTRPAIGRRQRAPASPTRSTRPMRCNRSASRERSRIRRGSCNRRRWPRWHRRSRVIGRTCRPVSLPTACCPTRSSRASSMPARPMPAISPGRGPSTRPWTSSRRRREDAENAVRFRRGWFLGDGTGAGKGRQVAGIILDNWLKGRRRAVWISKSDKLIEDAQRDWSALGQERLLVTPLARFRQGTPIRLEEGILFTTYATLRSDAREEKVSRVRQIVEWVGPISMGSSCSTKAMRWQTPPAARRARRQGALAAGARRPAPAARAARCPRPLRLRDRRDAPSTTSPMRSGSGSGAARISRSRHAPSLCRRSRPAASPRWRCWRATSNRSASMRRGRSPTRASNTSWSSTR